MTETLIRQIIAVRATGKANMLDSYSVQKAAHYLDFHELVIFIEDDRKAYARLIMSGSIEWTEAARNEVRP